VVAGSGSEPDGIRLSPRRGASPTELELLIDMGINHLLARQGMSVLHACAFEVGGSSVLGIGESFSGKSTVSMAALRVAGRLVSDDVVLAVADEPGPVALLPLRTFGWLRGATREIVPEELRNRMIEGRENGQARYTLYREDGGGRFADRTVPGVVWVQSIDRRLRHSRIEPVDHGHVFSALVRSTSPIFVSRHCPEVRDRLIPLFRSICDQCRGFRVRLGTRLMDDTAGEMERLLELSDRT
jgi:hypothetical protein